MGHGTRLDVAPAYGHTAPYMLDVGIHSTLHIARSWRLAPVFQTGGKELTTSIPPDQLGQPADHRRQGKIQAVIERPLIFLGQVSPVDHWLFLAKEVEKA